MTALLFGHFFGDYVFQPGDLISIERFFNIVVYVVIDNGLHIFLMYTGLTLFFPEYI
jgi:hypothetical protein